MSRSAAVCTFRRTLDAIETSGRIAVISTAVGGDAEIALGRLMQKRASVFGSVLRARPLEEKATAVRLLEREVLAALASGQVRPIVDSVFSLRDIMGRV